MPYQQEHHHFKPPYMMWNASKENHGNMVFFGALHFGTSDAYPLPAPLLKVLEDSQTIAFETDLQELASYSFSTRLQMLGQQKEGHLLRDTLSQETWNKLLETAASLGFSEATILRLAPWYCASLLTSTALRKSGLDNYTGVDAFIYRKAQDCGKTILNLESTDYQLQLLSQISHKTDEEFILQTIDEINEMEEFSTKMLELWLDSNPDGLAKLIADGFADNGELQKQMLDSRNQRWFALLDNASKDGVSVMTVVGAGHLVGGNSLLKLFQENGYRVSIPDNSSFT